MSYNLFIKQILELTSPIPIPIRPVIAESGRTNGTSLLRRFVRFLAARCLHLESICITWNQIPYFIILRAIFVWKETKNVNPKMNLNLMIISTLYLVEERTFPRCRRRDVSKRASKFDRADANVSQARFLEKVMIFRKIEFSRQFWLKASFNWRI